MALSKLNYGCIYFVTKHIEYLCLHFNSNRYSNELFVYYNILLN